MASDGRPGLGRPAAEAGHDLDEWAGVELFEERPPYPLAANLSVGLEPDQKSLGVRLRVRWLAFAGRKVDEGVAYASNAEIVVWSGAAPMVSNSLSASLKSILPDSLQSIAETIMVSMVLAGALATVGNVAFPVVHSRLVSSLEPRPEDMLSNIANPIVLPSSVPGAASHAQHGADGAAQARATLTVEDLV
jgi:hypothetical protein